MNTIPWLLTGLTLMLIGCSETEMPTDSNEGEGSLATLLQRSMQGVEPVRYYEYVDASSGLVQMRYPIPESWQVNSTNNPVYIEGPNGFRVLKSNMEDFAWSQDYMMQQTISMSGKRVVPPATLQQLLDQQVKPYASSKGYVLQDQYPVPEVVGFYQRLMHAMVNTGNRRSVEALGTEWERGDGKGKVYIQIVNYRTQQPNLVSWHFTTTELQADSDYFDEARRAYLYSLANAQLNPQWVSHMNGELVGNMRETQQFWAQASEQSAAAHRQRMQAIAARGETARSIGDTYSDILDISHQGYLNRSSINDAGHARTVRSINETALIGNHETGEHYNVPAGSNHYWVSNDGTYIGTDNPLFDPNVDNRLNQHGWTRFSVER